MTTVVFPAVGTTTGYEKRKWTDLPGRVMLFSMQEMTTVKATFASEGAVDQIVSADMDQLHLKTNLGNNFTLSGVRFKQDQNGRAYVTKSNGDVQFGINPVTGNGTKVGTLTPGLGEVLLDEWMPDSSPDVVDWTGVAAAPINGPDTPYSTYGITFRVPTAPLRPSSLSILGTMQDGTTFNIQADANGYINTTYVKGRVNYTTGVVRLIGVTPSATGREQVDLSFLGIPGIGLQFIDLIRQETLRYNAVAYTYLPMEASLLGINPVRLPSDGRVPIYRAGGIVVIGNRRSTAPVNVSNGQTIATGRTRLSRVSVVGADGVAIYTGWTTNLEAGTVTFSNVSGYAQPVHIDHRIEDMSMVRDVQIDGTMSLLRALTHDYAAGESYVSSAFMAGDLKSRSLNVFDQQTWDNTSFSDVRQGDAALATYNDTDYPIETINAGALTEKWVIRFTSSTAYQVIGESVGVIDVGTTGVDCAPVNTRTGEPYFTIPQLGWGVGWVQGNILRFNTVGAQAPVWLTRTVQQGPEAGEDYTFQLLARGSVDNPL